MRAKVNIKGIVQGVCYRASTEKVAVRLGLTGWVKNLSDGSVEALFEGDKSKIEEAINWCRKGPDRAKVTDLITTWEEGDTNEFSAFSIKY